MFNRTVKPASAGHTYASLQAAIKKLPTSGRVIFSGEFLEKEIDSILEASKLISYDAKKAAIDVNVLLDFMAVYRDEKELAQKTSDTIRNLMSKKVGSTTADKLLNSLESNNSAKHTRNVVQIILFLSEEGEKEGSLFFNQEKVERLIAVMKSAVLPLKHVIQHDGSPWNDSKNNHMIEWGYYQSIFLDIIFMLSRASAQADNVEVMVSCIDPSWFNDFSSVLPRKNSISAVVRLLLNLSIRDNKFSEYLKNVVGDLSSNGDTQSDIKSVLAEFSQSKLAPSNMSSPKGPAIEMTARLPQSQKTADLLVLTDEAQLMAEEFIPGCGSSKRKRDPACVQDVFQDVLERSSKALAAAHEAIQDAQQNLDENESPKKMKPSSEAIQPEQQNSAESKSPEKRKAPPLGGEVIKNRRPFANTELSVVVESPIKVKKISGKSVGRRDEAPPRARPSSTGGMFSPPRPKGKVKGFGSSTPRK